MRPARLLRPARPRRAAWLAGLVPLALGVAGTARAETRRCEPAAAPAPVEKAAPLPLEVLPGPGLALVLGGEALGAAACAPTDVAGAVLTRAVLDAEHALGIDAELAIVLGTAPLACGSIYYIPLANDVRGIGYAHHDAREVFDETPGQRLQGVAFLNDWPYWARHPEELPGALQHEVGHRWGARVHARLEGVSPAALLGRDQEHWSYFLATDGSPLEGNAWTETPSGFLSETPLYPARFSALDLYLMGVAAAEEVPAAQLLSPRGSALEDCSGVPLRAASPPQTCGSISLDATSTWVGIEDIIAAEGPRSPGPARDARSVDVLPVLLHSSAGAWSAAECEAAALALDAALGAFATATGGRLRLENVLVDGMTCSDLGRATALLEPAETPRAPAASTCAFRPPPAHRARPWHVAEVLIGAAAAQRWRRRRAAKAGARSDYPSAAGGSRASPRCPPPYPRTVRTRGRRVRWASWLGRRAGCGARLGALTLVSALCATPPAAAWEPSRAVELIVPAGAGGGADQMARELQRLSAAHQLLAQPVRVINKSGGDGAAGFLHLKASAGNPHKLLMALSNLFTTPRASGIPFSYRDLTPVAMLALDDFVLWVDAGSPYATAGELFAAIRGAPDATFSIGGTGLKQEDQLLAQALQKRLGKRLAYVAFRGGGEVAAGLAEKRVTCSVNNPLEALARWQRGQLRPLCVFRADRMPHGNKLPGGQLWSEIPSCREFGIELEYRMLRGVFLPSGASPEQAAYYVDLLRRVRELPEWRAFLAAAALEDQFLTGAAFTSWLERADSEHDAWMREAGLLAEPAR